MAPGNLHRRLSGRLPQVEEALGHRAVTLIRQLDASHNSVAPLVLAGEATVPVLEFRGWPPDPDPGDVNAAGLPAGAAKVVNDLSQRSQPGTGADRAPVLGEQESVSRRQPGGQWSGPRRTNRPAHREWPHGGDERARRGAGQRTRTGASHRHRSGGRLAALTALQRTEVIDLSLKGCAHDCTIGSAQRMHKVQEVVQYLPS